MSNYKVVSEIRQSGQWIDIPDDAIDVTIDPLAHAGVTRVTYLQPVHELQIDRAPSDRDYIH